MPTPTRPIRIDDETWTKGKDTAARRGDVLAAVIRNNLLDYIEGKQPGYSAGYAAARAEILARLEELVAEVAA